MQPKKGGKFHLKLNIGERPIANKYREGKMQRPLKRELKGLKIVGREPNGASSFVGRGISWKERRSTRWWRGLRAVVAALGSNGRPVHFSGQQVGISAWGGTRPVGCFESAFAGSEASWRYRPAHWGTKLGCSYGGGVVPCCLATHRRGKPQPCWGCWRNGFIRPVLSVLRRIVGGLKPLASHSCKRMATLSNCGKLLKLLVPRLTERCKVQQVV